MTHNRLLLLWTLDKMRPRGGRYHNAADSSNHRYAVSHRCCRRCGATTVGPGDGGIREISGIRIEPPIETRAKSAVDLYRTTHRESRQSRDAGEVVHRVVLSMDMRPTAIEMIILHLRSSVPIAAHLFPESQLLVSQFVGTITDDMFVRYYQELLTADDVSTDIPELIDLRSAMRFAPTTRAFSLIGDLVARIYKPTGPRPAITPRCAVLAPSDLAYGIARMYQLGSSSEAVELQVFRDLRSALRWLELSDPVLSQQLEILDIHDPSVCLYVE